MRPRIVSATALVLLAPLLAGCAAAATGPAGPTGPTGPTATTDPTPLPSTSPRAGASSAGTPGVQPSPAGLVPPPVTWTFDPGRRGDPMSGLAFKGGLEFQDGSVLLDGGSGHGATEGAAPIDTTTDFTVEAWVSLDANLAFPTVVSQAGALASAFTLGWAEGSWAFSMKDRDTSDPGNTRWAVAPAPIPEPGTWTHVAGVFDADGGEMRLYVDGRRAAARPFDDPWPADGPLLVGAALADGRPSGFWTGAIGHVAAYQAALDDDAIARLHATTRPAGVAPQWTTDAAAADALRGTWDSLLSGQEVARLVTMFSPEEAAAVGLPGAETRIRIGFDGRRAWQGFVFDGKLWLLHGVPEGDAGVLTIDGDQMTQTNGRDGWGTYRWAIDGDQLTMDLLRCVPQDGIGECADLDIVRFMTERTYLRSGTDPAW